jgi:2-oxoglutarate ferredoxin oxidoreductase subunit beta
LIFGADSNKGIRINHDILDLEVVTVGENGVTLEGLLVHDETNRTLAGWLARMEAPEFPVAIGVLYCEPVESYEAAAKRQIDEAKQKSPSGSLNSLLQSGHTWTIEPH